MRSTATLVALTVLAGVSWFASRRSPVTEPVTANADNRPLGFYLQGAKLIGTDEQGRIAYRILAQRLDEHPDQERLDLHGVNIEYQPAEDTPWTISATRASASKDGSELELTGSVELKSSPADGAEPERISTEQLRFSPDTSMIEAAGVVHIRIGGWRLETTGLRADLKGDTLRLESAVHGTFAH